MLLASEYEILRVLCWVVAWFVQMGLHEGGHAIVADRLGDHIPRAMGRVTINPMRHIEWNSTGYVIGAVVMPVVTAMMGWIPMGMAYVMHSRMSTANEAKIAVAGPVGSFLSAIAGYLLLLLLFPLLWETNNELLVLTGVYLGTGLMLTGLLYGVFNLLPIPPLDGGTIAYHYLNPPARQMFDTIRPYGFFILIALFWVFGIGGPLFSAILNNAYVFLFKSMHSVHSAEVASNLLEALRFGGA